MLSWASYGLAFALYAAERIKILGCQGFVEGFIGHTGLRSRFVVKFFCLCPQAQLFLCRDDAASFVLVDALIAARKRLRQWTVRRCLFDAARPITELRTGIARVKLNRLRPIALENLLAKLRKRTYRGKPIKEKTVQKYLTVVSAVPSDAKRNEIIEKNPARMIDLPDAERKAQEIPTMEEMQKFLSALCYEEPVFQLFYFLAINTGMRRGELCALRWSDVIVTGSYEGYIIVQHSRSTVSGEGVQEGKTKNGRTRTVSMNEEMFSLLRGFCYRKMRLRDEKGIPLPEYIFTKDDGTPIHPDTFSKHLKALFAEIGLPKTYHLHTLRHFFVSTLLHEGVDKNTVADLAGHGDTSFLERTYCHPQMQLKQEAAKRMSNSLFAAPNPELLVS